MAGKTHYETLGIEPTRDHKAAEKAAKEKAVDKAMEATEGLEGIAASRAYLDAHKKVTTPEWQAAFEVVSNKKSNARYYDVMMHERNAPQSSGEPSRHEEGEWPLSKKIAAGAGLVVGTGLLIKGIDMANKPRDIENPFKDEPAPVSREREALTVPKAFTEEILRRPGTSAQPVAPIPKVEEQDKAGATLPAGFQVEVGEAGAKITIVNTKDGTPYVGTEEELPAQKPAAKSTQPKGPDPEWKQKIMPKTKGDVKGVDAPETDGSVRRR